jgi:hypothetical protein
MCRFGKRRSHVRDVQAVILKGGTSVTAGNQGIGGIHAGVGDKCSTLCIGVKEQFSNNTLTGRRPWRGIPAVKPKRVAFRHKKTASKAGAAGNPRVVENNVMAAGVTEDVEFGNSSTFCNLDVGLKTTAKFDEWQAGVQVPKKRIVGEG